MRHLGSRCIGNRLARFGPRPSRKILRKLKNSIQVLQYKNRASQINTSVTRDLLRYIICGKSVVNIQGFQSLYLHGICRDTKFLQDAQASS